jgi:hypothetical protein
MSEKTRKNSPAKASKLLAIATPVLIGGFFLAAIAVVGQFYQHCGRGPEVPVGVPSPPSSVTFQADTVTLNYLERRMEISGTVRFEGATPPARVWVWGYFFVADDSYGGGSWSDEPIEARVEFGGSREAKISVSGPFHWWNSSETPTEGYFARTSVSAVSGNDAKIRPPQRDKSPSGAIRVKIVR